MNTLHNGSYHRTIRLAARAWALTAAPDGSAFGVGDSPRSEAVALVRFWDGETVQSQGAVDLPEEDGEVVDSERWTEVRTDALEALITDYVARARTVREDADLATGVEVVS